MPELRGNTNLSAKNECPYLLVWSFIKWEHNHRKLPKKDKNCKKKTAINSLTIAHNKANWVVCLTDLISVFQWVLFGPKMGTLQNKNTWCKYVCAWAECTYLQPRWQCPSDAPDKQCLSLWSPIPLLIMKPRAGKLLREKNKSNPVWLLVLFLPSPSCFLVSCHIRSLSHFP